MRSSRCLIPRRTTFGCSLSRSTYGSRTMSARPPQPAGAYPQSPFTQYDDSFGLYTNISKKLDRIEMQVPKEHVSSQLRKFWPDKEELSKDLGDYHIPLEDIPSTKTATPLNLKADEDFGKSFLYLETEKFRLDPEWLPHVEYSVKEVLRVARHTQVTAAGRVFSFSALVMLGTGHGAAGLGYGRAASVAEAVVLAKMNATKNMISLDLYRGNNIGNDIRLTYKKCYVWFKRGRTGSGRRASYYPNLLLSAFGITDCSVGKGGSRNKANLYRAYFLALRDGVRAPDEVARRMGRKLFNMQKAYYNAHE